MIVKIKTETYLPLCEVGAISEVAASAVNSLTPAPIPESAMPAMKVFIVCAVLATIMPKTRKVAPPRATYLLPKRSDSDPTKGQTDANASRLPRTNHVQRSKPPMSR